MTTGAIRTKDGRVSVNLLLEPALRTALRAEAERRNAAGERDQNGRPFFYTTVARDILRQAVGLGR